MNSSLSMRSPFPASTEERPAFEVRAAGRSAEGPALEDDEPSRNRPALPMPFEQVFRRHLAGVRRTLVSLGVADAAVDDAAQDVFLVIHQKLSLFEGRSQLSTWIYAITYRVAQNYRRKLALRNHEPLDDTAPSPLANPAECVELGEAARFVRDFCQGLSEAKRDAFVLCILEQRPAPEVARILEVKLDTVYSRVRIARQEFRRALERLRTSKEQRR